MGQCHPHLRSSLLSWASLETPFQTHPERQLLGESRSLIVKLTMYVNHGHGSAEGTLAFMVGSC